MRVVLIVSILALVACGVDGAPERPERPGPLAATPNPTISQTFGQTEITVTGQVFVGVSGEL